jgi:tetratricopeptide (TPR) repeat protein
VTLAACLIVKDAIDTIERCLASVRPHVDEVDIYDTGSTDGTLELLATLSAESDQALAPVRVERGEWRSDFSWARNQSFALASPDADWLLWLDADDVLEGGEWLRQLVSQAPDDVDGFAFHYDYARDADGNTLAELWRERIVRRSAQYRWVGRAHEVLLPQDGLHSRIAHVPRDKIRVIHERSDGADGWSNRNLSLLRAELDDAVSAGMPVDPRTALNLGLETKFRGDYKPAVDYFERAAGEPAAPDRLRRQAQLGLASCLRLTGKVEAGIDVALKALEAFEPGPDFGLELTKGFNALDDWNAVHRWAEYTIATPLPPQAFVTNRLELDVAPHLYLARAYLERGETVDATQAFEKAAAVKGEFLRRKLTEFEAALADDDMSRASLVLHEARAHYDEDVKEMARGLRLSIEDGF